MVDICLQLPQMRVRSMCTISTLKSAPQICNVKVITQKLDVLTGMKTTWVSQVVVWMDSVSSMICSSKKRPKQETASVISLKKVSHLLVFAMFPVNSTMHLSSVMTNTSGALLTLTARPHVTLKSLFHKLHTSHLARLSSQAWVKMANQAASKSGRVILRL